jgi:hypothetical protein
MVVGDALRSWMRFLMVLVAGAGEMRTEAV